MKLFVVTKGLLEYFPKTFVHSKVDLKPDRVSDERNVNEILYDHSVELKQ